LKRLQYIYLYLGLYLKLSGNMLLAIDQSLTNSGVCIFDKELVFSCSIKSKYKDGERLVDIGEQLINLLRGYNITQLVLEDYAYNARGKVFNLGELGGVIKYICIKNSIPYTIVPPTVIKKYVTGKGNAKKELMLLQVYKKFNVEFDDNNLADAYALGSYILNTDKKEIEKTCKIFTR